MVPHPLPPLLSPSLFTLPWSCVSLNVAALSSLVHMGALTGIPHGVPMRAGVTQLCGGSSWKSPYNILAYLDLSVY